MDLRPHIEKFSPPLCRGRGRLERSQGVRQSAARAGTVARIRPAEGTGGGGRRLSRRRSPTSTKTAPCSKAEAADSEMAQMAKEEIARLEAGEKRLFTELQFGLVPPNPTDSRNTIIEIRAGAGGSGVRAVRRRPLPHVQPLRRGARLEGRDRWIPARPTSAASRKSSSRSPARTSSSGSNTRAACTASSACPPPRRRAASTPAPPPSPCCPRPRKWTSRSSPTRSRSTSAAPPARAARASTPPIPPCRSSTSPPA